MYRGQNALTSYISVDMPDFKSFFCDCCNESKVEGRHGKRICREVRYENM